MEKFADVIKIFLEKHLIPSVISVAGSILTLLLIPEDSWIILKLGKALFVVLAFCVYFLFIQFLIKIISIIKKGISNIQEYNYKIENRARMNERNIQSIHELFDSLSTEDRNILLTFVRNGNKILINFEQFIDYDSVLHNTDIMNVSEYPSGIWPIDFEHYWTLPRLKEILVRNKGQLHGLWQFKLKDSAFHDFKAVYDSTGNLGNFR